MEQDTKSWVISSLTAAIGGALGFLAGHRSRDTDASAGALPGSLKANAIGNATKANPTQILNADATYPTFSFRWRQSLINRFNALPFHRREAIIYLFIMPSEGLRGGSEAERWFPEVVRGMGGWENETAINFFDPKARDINTLAEIYADLVGRMPHRALVNFLDRRVGDAVRMNSWEDYYGYLDLGRLYQMRGYTWMTNPPQPQPRGSQSQVEYLRPTH